MSSQRVICDFCNSPDVKWAYPTTDFTDQVEAEGVRGPDFGSKGGWACCEACSRLIESNRREALARRSAKKIALAERVPPKLLMPNLLKLHGKFFASRRGERVPHDPANPHDPTRVDDYGRMLAIPGDTMRFEVTRSPEAMGAQPGSCISKDGVEFLDQNAQMWMLSRIRRRTRETGVPPQRAHLYVTAYIDGIPTPEQADIYEYRPADVDDPARFKPMLESEASVLLVPVKRPGTAHDETVVQAMVGGAAGAWVMSRIIRAWKEKPGHTFGNVVMGAAVSLDGEELRGMSEGPEHFISLPDTGHRRAA